MLIFAPLIEGHCEILTYNDYLKHLGIPKIIQSTLVYLSSACLIIALICSLIASILFSRSKEEDKNTPRPSDVLLFVIFLSIIFYFVLLSSQSVRRGKSYDAQRIADMKQVQLALELYRDKFGSYPVFSGESAHERWENLKTFLEPAEVIYLLPDDYCVRKENKVYERQYDYKSTEDGKYYVIRALLRDGSKFKYYPTELDGEILGIWCGEQGREIEYCVGP